MFCLAALRRTRFGSTQVLTLRLPLPSVYPRVLTHSLLWHIGASQVYRAAIRRIPAAGSLPLRGRQAELDESQAPRSEPRRKRSFTGHRSSSFAERVRKSPAEVDAPGSRHCRLWRQRPLGQRKRCLGRPREGGPGSPRRAFGYFSRVGKVTAGPGCGSPGLS